LDEIAYKVNICKYNDSRVTTTCNIRDLPSPFKEKLKAVRNLPTLVFHKLLKKVLGKDHRDMLAYDTGSEPFVSLNKRIAKDRFEQANLRKHAG
jgi:hypothetical protein